MDIICFIFGHVSAKMTDGYVWWLECKHCGTKIKGVSYESASTL